MAVFCDYEIIGELGRGGMGAVYRARHKDGRIVALKVMRPEFRSNASAEKRFKRAPQLYPKNPNIVEVYDSGECDGTLFFAMQLIEGDSLSGILRRVRVFTPEQYAPLLRDICSGLDGSHAVGVIHRDIKPSNILIRAADNKAFLTDFDIAKDLSGPQFTSVAGAGAMIGTAHYMSPEQASGKQITPASDVYSLGAMSYEALAGRPPFQADSEFVIARMHLQDPPEDLYKANPAVSERVSAVVMKALNKEPRARYASAGAFAQAFMAAQKKVRVVALPRWMALAGGLAGLVIVAVMAIAVISNAASNSGDSSGSGITTVTTATATRRLSAAGTKVVSGVDATAVDGAAIKDTPMSDAAPGVATVTPDLSVIASATPLPDTPAPVPTQTPVSSAPTNVSPTGLPPTGLPPTGLPPTSPPVPTPAPVPPTPIPPTAAPVVIVTVAPPVVIVTIRPPILLVTIRPPILILLPTPVPTLAPIIIKPPIIRKLP